MLQLLDAMDGVAYVVDPDGVIEAIGPRSWEESAAGNNAPGLEVDATVGRSLFDLMDGDDIRALYRRLHATVLDGQRLRLSFTYRCDTPDAQRLMRMNIGAVREGGRTRQLLYQSVIVDERSRPPVRLLMAEEALARIREEALRPLLPMCSFCARLKWGDDQWVEAEVYYQLGGGSDVRLSHGVCPDCVESMESLMIPTA